MNKKKPAESQRELSTAIEELSRENTPESPVVQDLRRQTANAFVLYANYKHYHWQTYGPHFRDLHKLFDKFAEEVLETLDPLAERVRMIGPDPPAHPLEMTDLTGMFVTDTVEQTERSWPLEIVSVAPLIAGAIQRVMADGSMSDLS